MLCFHFNFRPELLEQLWKARAEKKKLRKTLREFEEAFYQQNGRFVKHCRSWHLSPFTHKMYVKIVEYVGLKTQVPMLAAASAGYQFDPQDLHRGSKESAPKGSSFFSIRHMHSHVPTH